MNTQNLSNVVAVDLGGSKLEVGLVNQRGEILEKSRQELFGLSYTRENILSLIKRAKNDLEERCGKLNIDAVGVSIPGPCDPTRGVFLHNFTTEIGNWSITEDIQKIFNAACYGDNDVNACALAEKQFGNCKDTTDYIWITLSFGCGGALFLNNKLYRGHRYLAGEVGHIPLEQVNPKQCGCGAWGDMEAEGAGPAIGRKYKEMMGLPDESLFGSKEVGEKARQGDKIAQEIFYQSGYYLGRLCAMAANMLNIQKAVLGGGVVVYDYELLEPGVRQAVLDCTFPLSRQFFSVEVTGLGYNASMLGAAALAINKGSI